MEQQLNNALNKQHEIPQPLTQLIGGYSAPTALYRSVELQVKDALPLLKSDQLYTLRNLCGDEYWQILGTAFCRRLAGRCFAHLVDAGILPFEFIQYKHSPTKRYQLK